MIPELITQLTQRLSQPLPGKKAQDIMMVYPGYPSAVLEAYAQRVPAGVMILLFPRNDGWYFFLTKRTDRVDHHKGQISLPGGVVQDGESLMEAALRETHEEIGVASTLVTVIGSLTSFNIPVSDFEIFPFISWAVTEPMTVIHDAEVDRVFSVSIDSFLDDKNQKQKKETLRGEMRTIPYFDLGSEQVWGATSIILSEFKTVLQDIL